MKCDLAPSGEPARRQTRDDLHRSEGVAELIGGRIVARPWMSPRANRLVGKLFRSLSAHAEATGRGEVFTASLAYVVPELRSGRESFSPSASYHLGPWPADPMEFIDGAPTLAVEVRSKADQGLAADRELAAKRLDYFEAGTLVVWDVDPVARCVRVYRPGTPEVPAVFEMGQEADAEPAVPGWRLAVDRVFA